METKVCKSCQSPKPLSDFYRHTGFKDGLHCNCKTCEASLNHQRSKIRARKGVKEVVSEKQCSACHVVKPSEEFFKDKGKKTGLASSCKECSSTRARNWVSANKERDAERRKQWYSSKKVGVSSRWVFWADQTQYDKSAVDRERYSRNKEKYRQYRIAYKSTSRGRGVRNEINRRAFFSHPLITPAWADRKAIQDFYSACPKGMQVDHVIPINGKTVCGLHVLENLQYLTKSENAKKWNRFNIEEAVL